MSPTKKFAFNPAALVAWADFHTEYRVDGHPNRLRRYINGRASNYIAARVLRRWRSGSIKGVTYLAARGWLADFNCTVEEFIRWTDLTGLEPILHGALPRKTSPKETT